MDYNDDFELINDLQELHSVKPELRIDGSFRLRSLSDPRALPDLFQTLAHDSEPDSRASAAWALSHYQDHRVVEPLCLALNDSEAEVREKAAFALGQIRDHRAVEPLIEHLNESDDNALKSIILALGKQEDPCAIKPLCALLKQERSYMTEYLLEALGLIAAPECKEVLLQFMDSPLPNVQAAAKTALHQLESRENLRHGSTGSHLWFHRKHKDS